MNHGNPSRTSFIDEVLKNFLPPLGISPNMSDAYRGSNAPRGSLTTSGPVPGPPAARELVVAVAGIKVYR